MTTRYLDPKICAKRLKELRKEKGWTQEQLAYYADINVNSIKNYESGRRTPQANISELLGKALKVNPKYITGESEYRNDMDKFDALHPEVSERISNELKLMEYAECIGCVFSSDNEEEYNTFFNDVTAYMKKRYSELMK